MRARPEDVYGTFVLIAFCSVLIKPLARGAARGCHGPMPQLKSKLGRCTL